MSRDGSLLEDQDPDILPDPENRESQDTQIQSTATGDGATSMVSFRST